MVPKIVFYIYILHCFCYICFFFIFTLALFQEHATFKMPPIQQHQLKKTLMSQSSEKVSKIERIIEFIGLAIRQMTAVAVFANNIIYVINDMKQ